ncbi:MAG: lytic transglycosylase domain-containing protein [bacterium]
MISIESTTWRAGRRALEKALSLYLNDPTVALVDLGFRLSSSAPNGFTPELAVRIHVRNELSNEARDELAAEASLCLGFAVEIIAANYDLHLHRDAPEQLMAFHERAVSSILHDRQSEKFGGRVRDRQSGEELMLGSWHVLANSPVVGGDFPINQSASTNGNETIRSAMHAGLDAAVIRLCDIWKITTANGVAIPQLGMSVIKSGRDTSETCGIIAEIYEMSRKYSRLDVELICATITHESGRTWNPEAISPAGALGLMQILPTTGIYLAKVEGLVWTSAESILFDPIYNLRLGCRYLAELISTYGVEAGLAAYNGGDRQAKLWLQGGRANQLLHAETAYYVPAVLRIYEEYRRTAL